MADVDVDDRSATGPSWRLGGGEPRLRCPTASVFVPTQDTSELARTYSCTVTRDEYYATYGTAS